MFFDFQNKKFKICLWGTLISLAVLCVVFFATDGLLGDKEFSEYTQEEWSIAILPLSAIIAAFISTLVFSLTLIIPLIRMHPVLTDYLTNKKYSDIESDTEFLVFDHHEFKRACCRTTTETGVWFSIKEYNLKTRSWIVLEEGRHIENADDLAFILHKDYKYDKVTFYLAPNRQH